MADKKKIAEGRAVEAALANAKKAKDKFDSNFTGMSDKEKKRAAKGPMLKEFDHPRAEYGRRKGWG
jgi:multidrug resistance efflux pump